ncbi:MAG: zinc-ribbon domain-containing protein [Deltaproteobacteria bacterium]|nr:zinc-ribbon domain-containing protein [Deltaproteobacteria bacterium]
MNITCENCQTTFRLDESLLAKEGSKVRCSICKHVFLAYPPLTSAAEQEFEETIALDSPPLVSEDALETPADDETAFDQILEESLEEQEATSSGFSEKEIGVMEEVPDEEVVGLEPGEELEEEEPFEETYEPEMEIAPPRRKKSGTSKVLIIILIILLLLVGGVAAMVYWAPQFLPDFLSPLKPVEKSAVLDKGVRRLSFKAVTGSFVKTKKAGRLFVIKGIVTNGYSKNRRFILIKGTILDDKGNVVRKKLAYAGNSFTKQELNRMSLSELEKAMKNRLGREGKNADIPPDGSIPFTIVFEKLPENLSEFTVEAVSSSPVK